MKIRNGFVSNSSSSSFIVNIKTLSHPLKMIYNHYLLSEEELQNNDSLYFHQDRKYLVLPNKKGKYEFDWEEERTYNIMDKLNYLAIQILYAPESDTYKYQSMLQKAITSVDPEIEICWDYNATRYNSINYFAHIDHQSAIYEDKSSVGDVFESVEAMKNFIFNDEAYIQGGNDNGGNESDEYRDSLAKLYGNLYLIHEDYEYADIEKKPPLVEGTCKDCGSDVIFQLRWNKEEDGESLNWEEQVAYYGLTEKEANNLKGFGYYRCINPACKNHKRTFVEEENCDSRHISYINWNKKVNGIMLTEKEV